VLKRISVEEVRFIVGITRAILPYDEPIPAFDTRLPNILESSLAIPFQEVGGHSPYRGTIPKASILFYLLIKNHPFRNGNKRIAVMVLLVFLGRHTKKWIKVDLQELYDFTIWVAESNPKNKNFVLMGIESFIRRHLQKG